MDLRKYKLKTEMVQLPDGQSVRIKELPAADLVGIQTAHKGNNGEPIDDRGAAELYARLTAACVVDESDKRYLNDDEGIEHARQLPWQIVYEIGVAAARINGMLEEKKSD